MGRSQVIYNRISAKKRADRNNGGGVTTTTSSSRNDDRDNGSGRFRRRDIEDRQRQQQQQQQQHRSSTTGSSTSRINFFDDDENDEKINDDINNNNNDDDSIIRSKRTTTTSTGLPPFSPSSRSLQQKHGNNQSIIKHGRTRGDVFRRSQHSDDMDDFSLHRRPKTSASTVEDEADALLSLEIQSRYQYTPNQTESTVSSLLLGARRYYSTTNSFDQGMSSSSRSNSRRNNSNNNSSSTTNSSRNNQYHRSIDTGMPSSAEQVNALCTRMGETLQCIPAVDQWRIAPHLVETMYSASERRRQQMKIDEWKKNKLLSFQDRTQTKFDIQSGAIQNTTSTDFVSREGIVTSDNARNYNNSTGSVSSCSNVQRSSSLMTQDEDDDDCGSHLLQEPQLSTSSSYFETPSVFLEPTGTTTTKTSLISISRNKYDSSVNSSTLTQSTNNIVQPQQPSVKAKHIDNTSSHHSSTLQRSSSFSSQRQQGDVVSIGSSASHAAHSYEAPTQAWIHYQEQQTNHHLNTPKASPLSRKSLGTSINSRPPPSPSLLTTNSPKNSRTVTTPVRATGPVSSMASTNIDSLEERSIYRSSAATSTGSHQSSIHRSPSSISSVTQPIVTFVEESTGNVSRSDNRYRQIDVIDAESAANSSSTNRYFTDGTSTISQTNGISVVETISNRSCHTSPRSYNSSTAYGDNNHSFTSSGSTIQSESIANRHQSNIETNRLLYSNSSLNSNGSSSQGRMMNSLSTTVATTIQPTTVGGRQNSYQNGNNQQSSNYNQTDIINVEDLVIHSDIEHHNTNNRGREHQQQTNIDLVPIIVLDDMSSSIEHQSTEDTMDKWLEGALLTQSSNTTTVVDDDYDGKRQGYSNSRNNTVVESEQEGELDSWLDSVIS